MFVRSLARASTLFGALVGGVAGDPHPCRARHPTHVHGQPTRDGRIPNINDPPVAINLRELGVVSGAGPLIIDHRRAADPGERPDQAGGLFVDLFPNNGSGTRLHHHR